jgi:hypothetical protein
VARVEVNGIGPDQISTYEDEDYRIVMDLIIDDYIQEKD